MGFEIIFNEECAKIKNNSVTLGGLTCCLAEGDWDMFFQVGLGEYLSEEIQLFAKQFLDICYDNKKFSSPSIAYASFIIENGLMKSNYAVSKKMYNIGLKRGFMIEDTYYIDSLYDLVCLELMYAINNNISLTKCKNCGKYFSSINAGTQYCDREFDDGRSCKRIGAKKQFTERLKSDELLSKYEKVYQTIYYKKRNSIEVDDLKKYSAQLSKLTKARTRYKKGEISSEEFNSILEQ